MNPTPSPSLSDDLVVRPARTVQPNAGLMLLLRHPSTGESMQVPLGYSVPVLLLGPFVLFRRGDWRSAVVSLLLPIVGQVMLAPTANRSHLKLLLRRGFRAVSTEPGHVSRIEWELGMQLPRYTGRSTRSST